MSIISSLIHPRPESRWGKLKALIARRPKTSAVVAIAALGIVVYAVHASGSSSATQYFVGTVERQTIVATVSGTGQVSTINQVDVKPKASGDVVSVNVKTGDQVRAGQTIAALDSTNAGLSLESARLSLQKLTQPADAVSVTQAKNTLSSSYNTGFNDVASAYIDLPSVMQGLNDLMFTQSGYLSETNTAYLSPQAENERAQAVASFGPAKSRYDALTAKYQSTPKASATTDDLEALVSAAYDTLKYVSQELKDTKAAADFIIKEKGDDGKAAATSATSNLSTWTNEVNSHLADMLAAMNGIENAKGSLAKLEQGNDPLDIKSQELAVEQRQLDYNNSFITTPVAGVVAKLSISPYQSVGSGDVVATIISPDQYATLTLNEVDITKVKPGQKATLTFDAIDGLTIAGTVAEVDSVGAVSQGVVSYGVKIKFDSSDSRVRPGMSVNASIITDVHADVLAVPSSAVKAQGNNQYIEELAQKVPDAAIAQGVTQSAAPTRVPVETGLSDDMYTEITSGLNEGDQVIIRSAAAAKTTATAQAPSLLGGGGARTGGNATFRAVGR